MLKSNHKLQKWERYASFPKCKPIKRSPVLKNLPLLPTSMRAGCLIVATVAFFRTFASAEENRDDNKRCPLYGNGTRALNTINPSMRRLQNGPAGTGKAVHRSMVADKSIKNLRGVHRQRHLDKNYNFQLKMYWEEGYCWQNEWNDRMWCLECEETSCDPDSHLWLKKCDDKKEQRFTYEIINSTTQAVKISPLGHKELCWTAIGDNEMMLKECGDSYKDYVTGLDKQVLIGFAEGGRFQLHPNGFAESNPNVYKCISSHLHPKEEDIIYADLCEPARALNTSRLIVFNAEGPSQTPPPSPPTPLATDVQTSSPDSLSGGDISAPTASPSTITLPSLFPSQPSAATASPSEAASGGDISALTASPSMITLPSLIPSQPLAPTASPSGAATPFPTSSPTNKEASTPTAVIDGKESTPSPTPLPTAAVTLSPETPSKENTESPTEGAAEDDDALPDVKAVSGSYCTPTDPCAQCYGDCDTNDDCQDNLQCYQRDGGQAVPSCSGGEDSISDTDYCIDPSWEDGTPRVEEDTASPTGEDETAWPSDGGDTSSPSLSPTQEESGESASPTKEEETARPSDGDTTYSTLSPTEQPSAETAFPTEG